MSDSDNDYIDVGEEEEVNSSEEAIEEVPNRVGCGRGKDIAWVEMARYKDKAEYENSVYHLDIRKYFTLRKPRENWYSDNEHYTCKYARKRGFLKCPIQYKVHFLTTSEEVVVEGNTRCHIHKEDTDYTTSKNFHWTIEQTEIVLNGVRNEASTKVIKRNLKDANVFSEDNFPSQSQLTTKIHHCRKIISRTIEIFDTHQLRQKIGEKLEVPADDTESYIVYHHVDDEDSEVDPHFSIIWTSKKLLARIGEDLTQDDATYRYGSMTSTLIPFIVLFLRLTWQGYPFFVSGRSCPTGKFFPTHVTLASHEDTRAWETSYKFVKDIVIPRYVLYQT